MTCIVGVVRDGVVTMGADTRAVCGWQMNTLAPSVAKLFRLDDLLVGVAGSIRICQVVRYALRVPSSQREDPAQYMVCDFAAAVRECLRQHACIKSENGTDILKADDQETSLLIGRRGRLFRFCPNQAILENPLGYDAIGGGMEFALGSLHATDALASSPAGRLTARARTELALEAASSFSMGVGAPFVIEELRP